MDDAALTKLLCSILGELPGWEWQDSADQEAPFPDDAVVVYYGAIGPKPDRAVGVRVYGATDEELEHLHWRRVQLRLRGEAGRPDGADALATQAFQALQGLSRVKGINGISRQSFSPAGADLNRREERTENYLIILDNQEAQP